jgi:hypothetical protein
MSQSAVLTETSVAAAEKQQYSVQVFRTVEELSALRTAWADMAHHPNADIDFYLTILSVRPEILRPHVIVLLEDGRPVAMMVGRLEDSELPLTLGYRILFKPRVRLLTIVYGGVFGEDSRGAAEAMMDELLATLSRGEADIAFVNDVRADSELHQAAMSRPPLLSRPLASAKNMHWRMDLASSLKEFMGRLSAKGRHELQRVMRRPEKLYPGKVLLREFRSGEELDRLCRDCEDVASKTYLRGMDTGFVDNEENRQRLALCAGRGWLRAFVLYVNEEPWAFWIGTLYKGVLYLNFTGYNPAYSHDEPGTIAFLRMVDALCQQGVTVADFGFGDAFYKRRFGTESWQEVSLYLFAPTFRNYGLNLLRALTIVANQAAQGLLKRAQLLSRIKRNWRRRLTPTAR